MNGRFLGKLTLYPNRVITTNSIKQIPEIGYVVYILFYENNPIVVGHGQKKRAKIIFDDLKEITNYHFKALTVRLFVLFGDGDKNFKRCFIKCKTKETARKIEKRLQDEIGGNKKKLTKNIENRLFRGLKKGSLPWLFIQLAIRSQYSGISDLRKWRKDKLIDDKTWEVISKKLQLPEKYNNYDKV